MANEIPVYLFVGFLESGKTKFIQETFEDPNFDSGDKTLLLVCEEGEEEYNQKKFAFPGVTLYNLEDKAELNPQNLAKLAKEADAGRVVIEYNGMWLLQDLANNLPENWIVYQCIATADGTTALTYARDNSMRSLMLDKIARSELIVFNRAEAVNNDAARQELHKLVRQASRKCDIAYEFADGSVAYDDIPAKASLMSFLIRVVLPAPRKPEKISILVMIQLPLSSNSTQSRRVLAQKSYTPIITRLSMGKPPFSRKNCNFFCKLAAF